MKVLLYINSYLPKVGGRELVVHMLATKLQEMGNIVLVVGPGGVLRYRKHHFDYPLHRWFKVPFVKPETGFKLHLLKTKMLHDFDVVHAHTTYPAGFTVAGLKDRINRPLVITPHGMDINIDTTINHGMRLDPSIDQKVRFALSQADAITAISEQVKLSLQSAGVEPDRITLLPNGVDIERFKRPSLIDARAQFNLPENAKLVVTIGNYHRRKGHELLIEAVRRARQFDPHLVLVIVGAKSDALVDFATREGLLDWLKFTGSIPLPVPGGPDLLAGLLQTASVYVSSSMSNTAEGMSLAVLEAMAAGSCVIASNISGSADLLANGKFGILVPANDCEALSQNILMVLNDDNLRATYQAAAFQRAEQFGWEEITRRYLSVYESVIN